MIQKYPGLKQMADDLKTSSEDDYEQILIDYLEEFIDGSNQINEWVAENLSKEPPWIYPWIMHLASFDLNVNEIP